jgi:hypothetical protein
MTAGVAVPIGEGFMMRALASAPFLLRKSRDEALGDRRLAEAVYRTAIFEGITGGVHYQDVPEADEA